MTEYDFKGLARALLSRARELLPIWLPGGKLVGHEYMCGSLRGERGDSLRVNINTGLWADFAGVDKGGDLVSLYAAIQGVSQGVAARELAQYVGFQALEPAPIKPAIQQPVPRETPQLPPIDAPVPTMQHPKHGEPSNSWTYKDADENVLFYIARYDTAEGKEIIPWSWDGSKWVAKGWPAPRPLFGLPYLKQRPSAPVLIVEGEKAAVAAQQIAGRTYVVITWPNGSKAVSKADWTPIYGRKVLIWPDADTPGLSAAHELATLLQPHCPEIKIITPEYQDGWDAADALDQGWDWSQFAAWAKPRVQLFTVEAKAEAGKAIAAAQANVQVNVTTEPDDPVSESLVMLYERLGVVCTGQGNPVLNINNLNRIFSGLPIFKGAIWFDEFHRKYFTTLWTGQPREWRNIDDLKLTNFLQLHFGLLRLSDDIVNKAIQVFAHQDVRNEPKDWMESLVWDGTPRIETFLIDCAGAIDNEYTRSTSRNFWTSMVARVYHPGCKVDNMIILEGAQGKRKSTLLATIGGAWHTESTEEIGSKDFFQSLNGKLIVEFADLSSWSKSDVDILKKTITCRVDRYRVSYGRAAEDHPRTSIFAGTTNESIYLRDDTGARRFWPIKTTDIDIERARELRDQLFAEAVQAYKNGGSWWEMPDSAFEEQELRRVVDEWEHVIADYLLHKTETTVKDVATEALKIDVGKLDKTTQMRIARILKVLGWERETSWIGGKAQKLWVRVHSHVAGKDDETW